METIVTLASVITLVAALGALVLSGTLGARHSRTLRGEPAPTAYNAEVLEDPRSFFRVGLNIVGEAVPSEYDSPSDQKARAARQTLNLLRACPALAFAEVLSDRALAKLEATTPASIIWIVTSDEAIEFEYPDPGVSFSPVVIDNMKERGIEYRYFAVSSDATHERSHKLKSLVADSDVPESRLQIQFLPDRYWAQLQRSTDEMVIFQGEKSVEVFYAVPRGELLESVRTWVKVPAAEAVLQFRELSANWELQEISQPSTG